ncbi:MAG: hypothetical protein IKW17_07435 [Paludibacteraceae bacterium]|nr:hypothetical protein [Paludibacteraceae bacterium]
MKRLLLLVLLCTVAMFGYAETKEHRQENPHEVRLGIADSYFEACLERPNDRYGDAPMYGEGPLNHTGHIFAEYQYRVNGWFSAGVNIDCLYSWYYLYPSKYYLELGAVDFGRGLYSNLRFSVIPTLRFTYFHNELVDLYSAFGVGINYSDYSEKTDYYSAYRTLGAAFDVCALGVSVGKKHWFGAFELGGTTAFGYRIGDDKPRLELPIPFARLLRVSVGYRF